MTANLIQRVRTCSTEERRDVAMELAQTGTNEAVQELIRMVEGKKTHWYFRYTPDDQLIGVEALGETGKKSALDYLQRVFTTIETRHTSKSIFTGSGGEPRDDNIYDIGLEIRYYPLARGGLANWLLYGSTESVSERHHGQYIWPHESRHPILLEPFNHQLPKRKWPYEALTEIPEKTTTTHEIFYRAIRKLESSLRQAPPNQ